MKTAVLQVADTGPLESLVVMLRHAGYECYLPNHAIQHELRNLGCDTVLEIEGLVKHWGYDRPFDIPVADFGLFQSCDLYVDVKAHRNGPKIWNSHPRLKTRTLWYRINGGQPEHVVNDRGDHGDEVNPPCPVLTPNLWYRGYEKAYACWPPFYRIDDYYPKHNRLENNFASPICLIHNVEGWGYHALVDNMRQIGVKCYGVRSPDGLIPHSEIPGRLSQTLAMVHLKSNDAPGYALYEALSAACPIVLTRRLIWRCQMQDLFIPGETCYVFDRETHDALSSEDVKECTIDVVEALERLSDPKENQRIGTNGLFRLKELMWDADRDGDSFKEFMERMFS